MRFWLFLLALLLLLVAGAGIRLQSFNHFSAVEPVALNRCAPVTGIIGPEDIKIDAKSGLAFISSLDRRDKAARGAIHVFDVSDPLSTAAWRDRTNGAPSAFKPLGLDFYDDGEVRRLFVINEATPAVEVFDVAEDGALTHLESFVERRLTSPNNVVAVGPRQFYVTNDVRPGRDALIADLHFLMRVGSGDIFFVDSDVWRLAAEGLRFANGLALSPDGTQLYVAETAGNAVKVFDRDPATGALMLAGAIDLEAAPDNINMDEDGALWVGALPKPLLVPRLHNDLNAVAPSAVIKVTRDGQTRTIYRNQGDEQSAATVAARIEDKLLIGALYEQKFLLCDLPAGGE